MLDVIIKGCVIAGMVVGTGMEYFSYNVNPTYARERFHEAHDLIVKAWAAEGPFVWEGTHYRFRYINLWPQPSQKPHPPIWIPGSGSPETMEWVAHQRYTYMVLPSCGHLPHVEQPEALATTVLDFLEQIGADPPLAACRRVLPPWRGSVDFQRTHRYAGAARCSARPCPDRYHSPRPWVLSAGGNIRWSQSRVELFLQVSAVYV